MPRVSDFVKRAGDEPRAKQAFSSPQKDKASSNHGKSGRSHQRRRRPGREESALQWAVGEFQHQRKHLVKRFKEDGAWGVAFYFVDVGFSFGKGLWRKWH